MIAGANVPDVQLLEQTLEAIVIDRPEVTQEEPQHLCLDKGYDQPLGHEVGVTERDLKVGPFRMLVF